MHLVVVFGPPAVGKMAVGRELCARTGYKLFHNHMTVDPVLDIFPFGSPPFGRLVELLRSQVIIEACDADLPGLVFTIVWGVDLEDDCLLLQGYVDTVVTRGGAVSFVELYADLPERLRRDRTTLRLAHKRSLWDAETSQRIVHQLESFRLNTGGEPSAADALLARHRHVFIDNSNRSASDVADEIVGALDLPRA